MMGLYYCLVLVFMFNYVKSAPVLLDAVSFKNDQSGRNEGCQRSMTHSEIILLLSNKFCPVIKKNDRKKRDVDGGTIDIKALQTTINDHRVMIEYLFNNTINGSVLADALHNHARIGPSFTSWRDMIDLLCVGLLVIVMIYLLVCRIGLSRCDDLGEFLCRPIHNRKRLKKYDQEQQQKQPDEQQEQQQPQQQQLQ
jgi:Sec-independent protein translocase protein TatA